MSEVTPAGVVSTYVSGLDAPEGLAFDASGNLYVSNVGTDTVSKVTPAVVATTSVTIASSVASIPIDLGTNTAGRFLGLTQVELNAISAGVPGSAARSAAINVTAAASLAPTGWKHLRG